MLRPILKLSTIPAIILVAFVTAGQANERYVLDGSAYKFLLLGAFIVLFLSMKLENIPLRIVIGIAAAVVTAFVIMQIAPYLGTIDEYLAGRNPAASLMLFAVAAFTGSVVATLMPVSDLVDRCFGVLPK
jgi:hypothetical protein